MEKVLEPCLLRVAGLAFYFTCCFAWGTALATSSAIDITRLQHQWLRDSVEFLAAEEHTPLSEVQTAAFAPLTAADINQGISDKVFWLRFTLANAGSTPKRWILHSDTSYLDNLVVFYRDGTGAFRREHLTDRQPFHSRGIDYRYLSFNHVTPPKQKTEVYLKVYFDKADSVSLNFHLWDEEHFWDSVRRENLVYGGYYGILLILILISAIFALLLRQKSAFYYAAFLSCTSLMWLLFNGYAFQYLWPASVYWHNEGFHIIFLLFGFFGLQFSKAFLRTRRFQPRVHKLLLGLQGFALAGLALRAAGSYEPVLNIAFGLLAVLAVVIPTVSWRAYRKGLKYARWYTLAWLVYSLSILVCITSAYTEWFQLGMRALIYMQAGSLLEALFLMIAMAEWLLRLDTDRRHAIALANQDPLTGLGNRRLLQVQYEVFRQQFDRDGRPVFLVMLDLDHFKAINDSYGHEAGDYVLKEVAVLLEKQSRNDDVCIRYGGEEFAVLLRAENLEAVWQVAERIRLEFADSPTHYNGEVIAHTMSSGITPVLSDKEVLSVQEMMARADAALYQGKAAGRNQSTIYQVDSGTALEVRPSPA